MRADDSLAEHARSRPDHPAIEDHRYGRIIAYAELPGLIDVTVANLLDLGIQTQDLVGVMLPDSADHIVVRLALEKMGAVIIPIRRTIPNAEKGAAIDDLDVKAVITNRKYMETVPPGPYRLNINDVCTDRPDEGLLASPSAAGDIDESRPFITTRSSGTTGEPKRLFLSLGHILERSRIPIGPMELSSTDRYLQFPSLEYIHGFGLTLTMFLVGGTVVFPNPDGWVVSECDERKITLICLPPSVLQAVLNRMKDGGPILPDLKVLLTGSPVSSDLRSLSRAKFAPKIIDWYGTSEVGGLACATPSDHEKHPDSVGLRLMVSRPRLWATTGSRYRQWRSGRLALGRHSSRQSTSTTRKLRRGTFAVAGSIPEISRRSMRTATSF